MGWACIFPHFGSGNGSLVCELDTNITLDENMPIQPRAIGIKLIVPRDGLKGFSR